MIVAASCVLPSVMKKLFAIAILLAAFAHAEPAVQEVTVDVAGMFKPASITLKAGQPVRVHFVRGAKPSCADEIVFPELDIRKKIGKNETVTIDIPAQKARTLRFACGMNMMQGSLVIQ